MKLLFHQAKIRVEFEHPVVVRETQAFDLVGIDGQAWVTIDGDPRDMLLQRGSTLHIESGRNVVVSGMPSAEVAFVVAPPLGRPQRDLTTIRRLLEAAWRSLRVAQRLQRV